MKQKKKTEQPKSYDIEEYRRKKKRERLIHRLIRLGAVLLILGAIIGGVYLYHRYDVEQLIRNAATTQTQGTVAPSVQTTSFPVALDAVKPLGIEAFGDSVALLTSDEVALLESDGTTSFQFVHGYTNPVLKIGDSRVLTYDRGGYGYRLDSRQGNVYTGRSTNTILTGAAGHDSVFALVTSESYYAGSVTVYNKSGEELLKWSSADPIVDVDFSPDDKKLAVACVTFDLQGELVATVHIFDINKEEELATPSFSDVMPVAINYKESGQIHLICDGMLGIIEKDMETTSTSTYLRELHTYAFTHEGTVLVSSDSHEVSSTVTYINEDGETKSLNISAAVVDVAVSKDGICILTDSAVQEYGLDFQSEGTYTVGNSIFEIEMAGGRIYSLSASYLDFLDQDGTPSDEEGESD